LLGDKLTVAELGPGQVRRQSAAAEEHALSQFRLDAHFCGTEQEEYREGGVAWRAAIAGPTAVGRLACGEEVVPVVVPAGRYFLEAFHRFLKALVALQTVQIVEALGTDIDLVILCHPRVRPTDGAKDF